MNSEADCLSTSEKGEIISAPSVLSVANEEQVTNNSVSGVKALLFIGYWSNWFHVLCYYGVVEIFVCVNDDNNISSFFKMHFDVKFILQSDIHVLFKENINDYWLFVVEGVPDEVVPKLSLIQDLLQSVPLLKSLTIGLFTRRVRAFNAVTSAKWCRFSHHNDCGGATSAAFQVTIFPKHKFLKISPSEHRWTLKEIAKPTVRGFPTQPLLNDDVLLNLAGWREMHVLPSVFSATGWGSRRLTYFELLRCLDIPQQFDHDIIRLYGGDLTDPNWKHIILAPPGKVVLGIMKSLDLPNQLKPTNTEESDMNEDKALPRFRAMLHGDFLTDTSAASDDRNLKAVKSDDAEVPVRLWNNRIVNGISSVTQDSALEILRNIFVMRWVRRRVFRTFARYMKRMHGINWAKRLKLVKRSGLIGSDLFKDGAVGVDALERVINASWWSWNFGSTLLFWRWPKHARRDARDGSILPWKISPFPKYVLPQRYPKNAREKELVVTKISDPISKRYISSGFVESLSTFFHVPKGEDDIRIVYDMTKCGINARLWSPRFYLPVPDAVFDSIEFGCWMGDIDQGEMFLNYFADPELLKYLGVDVTEIVRGTDLDNGCKRIWMRWNRWAMGLRQSPYATTRPFSIGMEAILGNRRDLPNVFNWNHIRLNLPGSPDYSPSEPWVSKRTVDGHIPPDAFTFVDDIRTVGRTEDICDNASRRIGSGLNYLGEQEASRKRRPSSQRWGAWIGAIFRGDENNIGILTSQEK